MTFGLLICGLTENGKSTASQFISCFSGLIRLTAFIYPPNRGEIYRTDPITRGKSDYIVSIIPLFEIAQFLFYLIEKSRHLNHQLFNDNTMTESCENQEDNYPLDFLVNWIWFQPSHISYVPWQVIFQCMSALACSVSPSLMGRTTILRSPRGACTLTEW